MPELVIDLSALAVYNGWEGIDHIGEPIKPMCDLAKRLHAEGKFVKIVTARVAPRRIGGRTQEQYVNMGRGTKFYARWFVQEWAAKNLGFRPEITHQKDHLMLWLFDDRTVQVEPNTGRVLGRLPDEMIHTERGGAT